MRNLFFIILCCILSPIANAETDPDFFKIGSAWSDKMQAKPESSPQSNNYYPGYHGDPVFDKHGHLVVHEGSSPFSHDDAVEYAKKYNSEN